MKKNIKLLNKDILSKSIAKYRKAINLEDKIIAIELEDNEEFISCVLAAFLNKCKVLALDITDSLLRNQAIIDNNNIDLLMQPDIVSGFRVRTEGNKIILNWNRNKNIDLLGYNIFANNYWIGTVDEEDTEFVFNKDILNVPENSIVKITIEAFDYDGETSKRRASVDLKV